MVRDIDIGSKSKVFSDRHLYGKQDSSISNLIDDSTSKVRAKLVSIRAEYDSNTKWDAVQDSTESEMAYFKIKQNIIVRESNLVKFQDVASSLDAQYFNYAILRLKASARKQNSNPDILDEKRILIKKLQMELIIILAHVRGSSVTVIESIQFWRTTKKPLNSSSIEVTASIFFEDENYLLKMNTDFEIICEEYYTLKLWLGFHPNSLILPEYDEDQVNIYRRRAALLLVNDQNQYHQNDRKSSSSLSNVQTSFSLSSIKQVRSFSIPSPVSVSPLRNNSVSPIIRKNSNLNLNSVEMKNNNKIEESSLALNGFYNYTENKNKLNNNSFDSNNNVSDIDEKSSAAVLWENDNYKHYLLWLRRKQERQLQREKQRKSNGQHHFIENQNAKQESQFSLNLLLSSLLTSSFPASNVRQLYGHGTVDFVIFPDKNLNSNNSKFQELNKKLLEEISSSNLITKIAFDNEKKEKREKTFQKQFLLPFSSPESASDNKKDFIGKSKIDSVSSTYATDIPNSALEKKLIRESSRLGTDARNIHHMNSKSNNNSIIDIKNNNNNKNNKNNLSSKSNFSVSTNHHHKILAENSTLNSNINSNLNLNADVDKIFEDTEKWIKILKFISRISWGEKKSKKYFTDLNNEEESEEINEKNEMSTTDLSYIDTYHSKCSDDDNNDSIRNRNKTEMIKFGTKKNENKDDEKNEDENENKNENDNKNEIFLSKQGLKESPEFWSNLDFNPVLVEAAVGFIEIYPNQPLVPPMTEIFYNEMKKFENFLWKENFLFDSLAIRKSLAIRLKEEVTRSVDIDSIKRMKNEKNILIQKDLLRKNQTKITSESSNQLECKLNDEFNNFALNPLKKGTKRVISTWHSHNNSPIYSLSPSPNASSFESSPSLSPLHSPPFSSSLSSSNLQLLIPKLHQINIHNIHKIDNNFNDYDSIIDDTTVSDNFSSSFNRGIFPRNPDRTFPGNLSLNQKSLMGMILKKNKNDSRRKFTKKMENDVLPNKILSGKRFLKSSEFNRFDFCASVIQKATRQHIAKKKILRENGKSFLLQNVLDIQRTYRGMIGRREFIKERESFRKRMFFARNQILKKKRSAFIILKFIRSVVLIVRDTNLRKKGYHDTYNENLKTGHDDSSIVNITDGEVSEMSEHVINCTVGRATELEVEVEVEVEMVSFTSSGERIHLNQSMKGTTSGAGEPRHEKERESGRDVDLRSSPIDSLSDPHSAVNYLESDNHSLDDGVVYRNVRDDGEGDREEKREGGRDEKREGEGDRDADRSMNEGRDRGSEGYLKELPDTADTVNSVDINPMINTKINSTININININLKTDNIVADSSDYDICDDNNTDINYNNNVIDNNYDIENSRKISHHSVIPIDKSKFLNLHEKIAILRRMKNMKTIEKNKKLKESEEMTSAAVRRHGDVDKMNRRDIGNFDRISINRRKDSKISRKGNFVCNSDKYNENYSENYNKKYDYYDPYDSLHNNYYIDNDYRSGSQYSNKEEKNFAGKNNIGDINNNDDKNYDNNDRNTKYTGFSSTIKKNSLSRHSSFPFPTPVSTLTRVSSLFSLPALTTIKPRDATTALSLTSIEKKESNKDENKSMNIQETVRSDDLYDLLKGGNIKLKTKSNVQLNYFDKKEINIEIQN